MYPEPVPAIILPERGEKLAGWIYLPFYFLLIPLILGLVLGSFVSLFGISVDENALMVHLNFIYGLINFCFAAIAFRDYLVRSARQIPRFVGRFFGAVFGGFAIYMVGNLVMSLITQIISPAMENINDANIESMLSGGTLEMVIFTVLFAPLAEEVLFRGLIFTSLRTRNRVLAYIVTIVVFSAIHVLGYIGTESALSLFLSFIQYFPASFALIWAMEFGGSIWASIGVHTLANGFTMMLMLLAA